MQAPAPRPALHLRVGVKLGLCYCCGALSRPPASLLCVSWAAVFSIHDSAQSTPARKPGSALTTGFTTARPAPL
ncbi:hypothetical protein [Streptomyces hydrogenans]|uniref:hypothetical protein n=1 Tax=Streptomyces hydrogenans TaxID=1873719 RepID=UPI0035E0DF92